MFSMKQWRIARILVALALANFAIAALSLQSEAANQTFNDRWREIEAGQHTKVAGAKRRSARQFKLPISLEQALYLIRSTLLTLNDANRSGNYTVMRDLAAPGVQARYSPADLAQVFSDLRDNHVDLSVVALAAPKLSAPPKLQGNGQLRLTGHFSSQPRQINFDLLFQTVAGHWKWFGISVAAPHAAPSAAMGGGK